MRSKIIELGLTILLTFIVTPQAMSAESSENINLAEIEYLLQTIGQSECVFTRNGTQHSAVEAEDHLRMKYDRTKSRIKTAEAFIDRLASNSSWTGKPYTMRCTSDEPEPSGQWLYRELKRHRQT